MRTLKIPRQQRNITAVKHTLFALFERDITDKQHNGIVRYQEQEILCPKILCKRQRTGQSNVNDVNLDNNSPLILLTNASLGADLLNLASALSQQCTINNPHSQNMHA